MATVVAQKHPLALLGLKLRRLRKDHKLTNTVLSWGA